MPKFAARSIVGLLAAGGSLAAGPATAADPLDYTAATVVNSGDQLAANAEFAGHLTETNDGTPNVTCDQPRAYPYEVTKYQNLVVGSLHQHDSVLGEAHCASFTNATYRCELRMYIDYFSRSGLTTGTWEPTGFQHSVYGVTVRGVCDAVGLLDAIYPDVHAAVNKPRRVRAYVYTSLTGTAPVARYVSHVYGA